jgi:hypothetical protein
VTLVIAKTILFCIQNGGAYVQTNKQTHKQTLKLGKASPRQGRMRAGIS